MKQKKMDLYYLFKKIFVADEKRILNRLSMTASDTKFVNWLLENEYIGYASDYINGFHAEILVKDVRDKVELIKVLKLKDLDRTYCDPQYRKFNTKLFFD